MLIMECVSATKMKKSKKGRRYTDNWLLLCLLLQVRTPTGYRLLRENDIIPLFAVETLWHYISIVGLRCGFDQDFSTALKKKLSSKPQLWRHEIILFNEILVR